MPRRLAAPASRTLLGGRAGPWLALAAGALLPLAFDPLGWAWLAVLSPALLFAIAAAAPRRRALWAGYAFGLGFYGVGVSWVYISVGRYGEGGPVAGVLATVGFVAFLALFPWLTVRLGRWLGGERRVLPALALCWLLLEWVRTWLLSGFPWLLLGYSQTDSPLRALAPLFGTLGLSLAVLILSALTAWLLLSPSLRRAGALALALLLAAGLAKALERPWTAPAGEPISVALLQGNIAQNLKWDPDWFRETLLRYRRMTEAAWGAQLIVWPEAAIPTYHDLVLEPFLEPLGELAREQGSDLLIGVPVREGERSYNSMVSLSTQPGVYHKRHLVPFGEYLPLRGLVGGALDLLGAPMSDFSAGTAAAPLYAAGQPIGVSICYEAVFGPELAEALPESTLLVNVSNDAWFGDSLAPHQHLQMARMRAIETGRYLLRATNTGITAIIDERGRVTARAPQFEPTTLHGQAQPLAGATPYVRWLDYPVLALLAVGLAALAWRRQARPM